MQLDRRMLITGVGVVPLLVAARSPAPVRIHRRKIPGTDIMLPAIGLGTFTTFDLLPGAPRDHLHEVARRYWAAGARIVDTSPLYGMGEFNVGAFVAASATADPTHAAENVAALSGPLPDTAMRARMLAHMQSIPGFDRLEAMPCYPGKRYPCVIARAMAERAARLPLSNCSRMAS